MDVSRWKQDMVPQKGTTSGCSVTINTQGAAANDVFQIALVTRAAAFLVKECVTDDRGAKVGGKMLMGPK